jgi:phage shock protein A
MGMLELLVMRLVLWVGLPLILLVLALGPRRVLRDAKAVWRWFTRRRMDPQVILTHVVRQHEEHVRALAKLLADEEAAEKAVVANLAESQGKIATLETQARHLAQAQDELGARAAVYKLNLERAAAANFVDQLSRQRELIEDTRRRLYQLELQLRQYEVGRSILLSQLAAAEKVEQQYAIARQFDPFNAVANWQQAEGLVQQKSLSAKAIERVYSDTADATPGASVSGAPLAVDPAALEAELARLRGKLPAVTNGTPPPAVLPHLPTARSQPPATETPITADLAEEKESHD